MDILLITILTIVASLAGTISGFGTSTIMVPTLLFFMPAQEAIFLAAIVHWFQNIWRLSLFKGGFRPKIIIDFCLTGIIATLIGAFFTVALPSTVIVKGIGFFFIAYVLFLFFNPEFHFAYRRSISMLGGAFSGFMAGLFGVGGAFRAAVLSAFDLPKLVFLHSSAAIALMVDSSRLLVYIGGGIKLESMLIWGLLAFLPASYLGTRVGKSVIDRIPQQKFRYVICVFLFLASIKLILM